MAVWSWDMKAISGATGRLRVRVGQPPREGHAAGWFAWRGPVSAERMPLLPPLPAPEPPRLRWSGAELSSSSASWAGFSGATARSRSRASRASRSARKPVNISRNPFEINCLCRRAARSAALAVRNTFSARVGEDHRAHVAPVGHQARQTAERQLQRTQRVAHFRPGRDPRRQLAHVLLRAAPR